MSFTSTEFEERMSSFGQFRTMIGDEALNDFRDEDLVDLWPVRFPSFYLRRSAEGGGEAGRDDQKAPQP